MSAISHAENVADANLYKRIEWGTGNNKYVTRTCTVLKRSNKGASPQTLYLLLPSQTWTVQIWAAPDQRNHTG